MVCRGKPYGAGRERIRGAEARSKQEGEQSKSSCHCASLRPSRGSTDGASAARVVVTGRILDSFQFQEITAGCWGERVLQQAAERSCARNSLSLKSLVFHSHLPPFLLLLLPFPFPLLCAALPSQQQTGSAQRQAEE